jgi:hypothetical protein
MGCGLHSCDVLYGLIFVKSVKFVVASMIHGCEYGSWDVNVWKRKKKETTENKKERMKRRPKGLTETGHGRGGGGVRYIVVGTNVSTTPGINKGYHPVQMPIFPVVSSGQFSSLHC